MERPVSGCWQSLVKSMAEYRYSIKYQGGSAKNCHLDFIEIENVFRLSYAKKYYKSYT
jgi:hypothetical protein